MNTDTVISITTVPHRINTSLPLVINSLKKQTIKCKILVCIPKIYRRWNNSCEIPDYLKNDSDIIVWYTKKDYGPGTKFLGALEYIEDNEDIKNIITMDDDMYYDYDKFIQYMLDKSIEHPNTALTFGGIKLMHTPYRWRNGLNYKNYNCYVDSPAGCNGVLYPIEPFRTDKRIFTFMDNLPDGIYNDDDAYFGIILSIMNIPLYSIVREGELAASHTSTPQCKRSCLNTTIDSNIPRCDNESQIYQHAVDNNYLPSKFRL